MCDMSDIWIENLWIYRIFINCIDRKLPFERNPNKIVVTRNENTKDIRMFFVFALNCLHCTCALCKTDREHRNALEPTIHWKIFSHSNSTIYSNFIFFFLIHFQVLGIICMSLASPAYIVSTHWFLFVVVTAFIATILWICVYFLGVREVLNLSINWILTVIFTF